MKKSKLVVLGLFLVAVPLVFQLALIIWMSSVLWTIQNESALARQSRNRVNLLSDSILTVGDFIYIAFSARNAAKESDLLKEVAVMEKEAIDLLQDEYLETEESKKQIARTRTALRELTSLSHWALTQGREGKTIQERYGITPKLAAAADKLTSEITKLIEIEKNRRSQTFDISDRQRTTVQNWLIIYVIVSALFSAILAVFFGARITAPIKKISDNLKLLSENKPLGPALTNNDELGSLDRLIHSVANETNRALLRERSLIEKAADLICSLDETGTFLTANPMAFRMLSIRPSDLVGTRLNELTIPKDSFTADELVRRSISRNDFQSAELTLRKSDGTTLDTRWSCLWSDQEGSLFCVAHDITKEKELAEMKQDFMNMISHDLRSPLTSVIGGLTILETGVKGELLPAHKEEAESAIRSANKLVTFINDLLDFQKLDSGQMPLELESHNVHDLITEAVSLVDTLAKDREIEIQYSKEPLTASIFCDRQKITQVILNLVSNAIKFSPEKSVIEINMEEQSDHVRLSVKDRGAGVPEHMRMKIFEPFEQVHPLQHQGTGLGLAICKMIVEAHGGAIGVNDCEPEQPQGKPEQPQGSEFWFSIKKKPSRKNT